MQTHPVFLILVIAGLDLSVAAQIADAQTRIEVGQTIYGSFSTTDEEFAGRRQDLYEFRAPRTERLRVSAASTAIDPLIEVYADDPEQKLIASDDDSGEAFNAVADFEVVAGMYYGIVLKDVSNPPKLGSYVLTLVPTPAAAPHRPLSDGWVRTVSNSTFDRYFDSTRVTASGAGRYTAWIRMNYKFPHITSDYVYDAQVELQEFDCVQHRLKLLQVIRYKEDVAVLTHVMDTLGWHSVVPGSVGESQHGSVCRIAQRTTKANGGSGLGRATP